jgi:hypothetical protein
MFKILLAVVTLFGIVSSASGQQCQRWYEGCGSCVADGVWGSLRHETDCRQYCDKVCGAQPANLVQKSFLVTGQEGRAIFRKLNKNKKESVAESGTCACTQQEQNNCKVMGLGCAAEAVNGQCQKLCN